MKGIDTKPWGGRFQEEVDKFFEEFSESVSFDHELAQYEIKASLAYAEALKEAGVVSEGEFLAIQKGLLEIEEELKSGKFVFRKEYEDVHMNIEKALFEKIGEVAYKLHTGRSRNEQVVTDFRLYLVDRVKELKVELKGLMETIVAKAEEYYGIVMPGFTHLQHAQPVLFSHWIMAYYEMMRLHFQRLEDYEKRLKICPLGSSAFAGCAFRIDRKKLSQRLGFLEPTRNSVFAVSSRDFALELLFILSLIMVDLSRWCEEIILWMSPEFSFIDLPDRFCTGSSLMPQKKNPDGAELIRGKASSVEAAFTQVWGLMKGLPLSYNRDMQEDKPPVFRAVKTTWQCLRLMSLMVAGLVLKKENIEKHLPQGYLLATELADYLVYKGIPFRKAHHITGQIVYYAEKEGKNLENLTLHEFKQFSDKIEEDVYEWLTIENAIKRREIWGGTGFNVVKQVIEAAKKELSESLHV
ncbi:argininosuccinate lyase [Thermodesulfobacterium sp. TA1]|uniref:argininosuccinate lyase n=1 Tax=Thermodesulfobacterium sp. TA1 TaxID=2234087 RepID=UPI001232A308|nr:argininosuccinate lyase [Thermodesulfobacterium sp. TA1]QER41556.1 argininosuccinate lyase [Thermodesulfobacterium sp. TA1]